MGQRRRIRHNTEQIVKKRPDVDAMLNAGKDLAAALGLDTPAALEPF